MEQITFEVSDKSKLEALKAYAATLGEINIIEEEEAVLSFFKRRIRQAVRRKQEIAS